MRLLQRIVQDLRAGWVTLRQGTAEVANRALEESELIKLRLQLRKLDDQMNHLYEEIGERAVAQYERGAPLGELMREREIIQLLVRLHQFRQERAKLEAEVGGVRGGT